MKQLYAAPVTQATTRKAPAAPAAPAQATQAPRTTYVNEAMFGSGYQNDGSPFINIAFDRDMTEAQAIELVQSVFRSGRRISLQPVKQVSEHNPARKFVMVLRAPQA